MAYAGEAIEPVGLTLTIGGTSVGKITSINLALTMDDIDVTHFGTTLNASTHLGFKEYMPSKLRDGGELSGTIFFDPRAANSINLFKNTTSSVVITYKDSADVSIVTWTFLGYIKSLSPTGSIGSAMTADFSIKIAGAITVA